MKEFKSRRHGRKIILSLPVIALAAFIAAWLAWSAFGAYMNAREARLARFEKETELRELQKRADDLRAKIAELESEQGIERIARERFNVKKPDEEVIVITGGNENGEKNGTENEGGFFHGFWSTIKNIF